MSCDTHYSGVSGQYKSGQQQDVEFVDLDRRATTGTDLGSVARGIILIIQNGIFWFIDS